MVIRRAMVLGVVILSLVFSGVVAQKGSGVDQKADEVLKRMGDFLEDTEGFSFEAVKMMDFVLDDGQKIQFSDLSEIVVRRPGRIKVRSFGDLSNEEGWYDSDMLTMLDHDNNTYATVAVPETIDKMMDFIVAEYGITMPLADIVFSNPYDSMIENVWSGYYMGLNHIQRRRCHHLAFRQDGLDWQIWVDEGDQPLPRKLIITYKELPGHPQFIALFDHWELGLDLDEGIFSFNFPKGAERIKMNKILQPEKPTTPRHVEW